MVLLKNNNKFGQYNLGYMYYNGDGVQQSFDEALKVVPAIC